MVVRQTEPKGAVPPYLYNEHVPEKVVCYDSFASTPNWDFKTKTDLEPRYRIIHGGDFWANLILPEPSTLDPGRVDWLSS